MDCLDKESNWFVWLLCKCPPGGSPEYNGNILRESRQFQADNLVPLHLKYQRSKNRQPGFPPIFIIYLYSIFESSIYLYLVFESNVCLYLMFESNTCLYLMFKCNICLYSTFESNICLYLMFKSIFVRIQFLSPIFICI